jgi:hypothetical protein
VQVAFDGGDIVSDDGVPLCLMTGGAAVKMAPITELPFEMIDSLIFDGLLALQADRQLAP